MSTRRWLVAATVLGTAHAATSLVWALGSTWLLDTVGGQLEEWGRDGGALVRLALIAVVLAKLAAVALLWAAVLRPRRAVRVLAWTAGGVLTLYGGALTAAGVVIALTSLDAAADPYALQWHAYFWDPWFLMWGLCSLATLWTSRISALAPRTDRRR